MRYKRVAIKIGSNVLANSHGALNTGHMLHIAEQIALVKKRGIEVILISSGAVSFGRQLVHLPKKNDSVSERQLLSSVGQVHLMNSYYEMFRNYDILCSQILVTREDFRDRQHYLNMKNCFDALLKAGIIPIVNENDAISVTALMFTDNDELAGLVSSMMNCDALLLMTNVDGIFTGHPKDPESKLLPVIDKNFHHKVSQFITAEKSQFGRGGMITKFKIAKRLSDNGMFVHIANGTKKESLASILLEENEIPHTRFVPDGKSSTIKKWIANSEGFEKAGVIVNKGAVDALNSEQATSLLLIGVTGFEGEFKKGDILRIVDEMGNVIGLGKAQYDHSTALKHMGEKKYPPLIHYDYLYIK